MVTLTDIYHCSVKRGQPSKRTTLSAALYQPGLYGKRHMTARLEFTKSHLKDSQTTRNYIVWSDETKIEHSGLNARHLSLQSDLNPKLGQRFPFQQDHNY